MIRIRRGTPSGVPPETWARVTVARIRSQAELRALLYGKVYDAAWRNVLGKQHGPSRPGEPPGYRTRQLMNAPEATTEASGQIGRGFRFTVRHTPAETRIKVAGYLEEGTSRMAARPFREAVLREAAPAFQQIAHQRRF